MWLYLCLCLYLCLLPSILNVCIRLWLSKSPKWKKNPKSKQDIGLAKYLLTLKPPNAFLIHFENRVYFIRAWCMQRWTMLYLLDGPKYHMYFLYITNCKNKIYREIHFHHCNANMRSYSDISKLQEYIRLFIVDVCLLFLIQPVLLKSDPSVRGTLSNAWHIFFIIIIVLCNLGSSNRPFFYFSYSFSFN